MSVGLCCVFFPFFARGGGHKRCMMTKVTASQERGKRDKEGEKKREMSLQSGFDWLM